MFSEKIRASQSFLWSRATPRTRTNTYTDQATSQSRDQCYIAAMQWARIPLVTQREFKLRRKKKKKSRQHSVNELSALEMSSDTESVVLCAWHTFECCFCFCLYTWALVFISPAKQHNLFCEPDSIYIRKLHSNVYIRVLPYNAAVTVTVAVAVAVVACSSCWRASDLCHHCAHCEADDTRDAARPWLPAFPPRPPTLLASIKRASFRSSAAQRVVRG